MCYDSCDDACVYKFTEDVSSFLTVDFFTPIVDDPYQFGQIAASEWEGDATFSLEGGHSLVRRIRFWADHSDGSGQISYQTSIALGHIIEATFWLIPGS